MIVKFYDMNSGGRLSTEYKVILISCNDESEARSIFTDRFGLDSRNVSCSCCGPDFSVTTYSSLEGATAIDRMCQMSEDWEDFTEKPSTDEDAERFSKFSKYVTFSEFLELSEDVLVIKVVDIVIE